MTLTELQSSQQSVAVERQRQAALSSRLAGVTSEKDELEHALTQTRDKLQVRCTTFSLFSLVILQENIVCRPYNDVPSAPGCFARSQAVVDL